VTGLGGGLGSFANEGLASWTITGDRDEERARRLRGIGARGAKGAGGLGGLGSAGLGIGSAPVLGRSVSGDLTGSSSLTTASLLARGYQPAVVKVVSYAQGVTRATASAQYIERDEVELETHDGVRLPDKDAVAEEIKAWSASFEKRTPSQDVVAVRVQLSGLRDTIGDREVLGSAVAAAFDGHRHAVRIDVQRDGVPEARVVAIMARTVSLEEKAIGGVIGEGGIKRSALPPRIRVMDHRMGTTNDAPIRKVFDARSEAAMKARIEESTGRPAHSVSIEPATPGHGRDALGQRLNALVSKGPARSYEDKPVRNAEDIRDVTRDWGRHLRSQSPRDTMHMVVSAKAGTDVKDFTNAVRSFLHDRFSDHKFMFGVHTDKAEAGHIHAHAIVAVRSETGAKLHPGPSDLAQWRVTYAAHAREHGLQVVATRAAEQASSRSYGPKDKSIVDVATTPRAERKALDRAYASDPRNANLIRSAQVRMETARANPIRIPETDRARAGVTKSLAHWRVEAKASPENDLARTMVQRLTAAIKAGNALTTLKQAAAPENRKAHQHVPNETSAPVMTHPPKSASGMLRDLRLLNQKAADVVALLPDGSRAKFLERAGTYLEKIADRVDQQRAEEAKAQAERTAHERQAMAPVVEKAEQIARTEAREAQQATKAAGRAIEAERKVEGAPLSESGSMAAIDQKRALVREVEKQAAAENREARDAFEAARSVAADPTKPLQTSAVAANDRVTEIRRKQAEMLAKLSKERAQAEVKERGHEQGD
jgi:type IV secretory pathway VirD2 relaxase